MPKQKNICQINKAIDDITHAKEPGKSRQGNVVGKEKK